MRQHPTARAGRRRLADLARRVAGAVIIGVAAILLPKAEPDQHWSQPPVIEMTVEHDQAAWPGADPKTPPAGR